MAAADTLPLSAVPITSETSWDRYVMEHDGATPFHRWAWLELMAAAHRSTFLPFGIVQAGSLVGLMPLIVKPRGLLKTANWLPFPYLGPLVAPGRLSQALQLVATFQHSRRIGLLQLGFFPGTVDEVELRRVEDFTAIIDTTMMLPLTERSEDDIWKAMPSRRWNVRQARKAGVVIRQATEREVSVVLPEILDEVFTGRGLPSPYPRRTLRLVWERYHDDPNVHMTTAEYNGDVVGVHVTMSDSKRAFMWQGAGWHRYRHTNASSLLYWDAICWARERGCVALDMVGNPDQGIARFKAGFGGIPTGYVVLRRQTSQLYRLGHEAHSKFIILGHQMKQRVSTVRERPSTGGRGT